MKTTIQALRLFLVLTVLTGIVYPFVVTFFARAAWSEQAGGSLLKVNGRIAGSALLAQKTEDLRYFWPRPSACDYATIPSGASNLGPSSAALQKTAQDRAAAWRKANNLAADIDLPGDVVFASGSGLDPDISPRAAQLQVERVAGARHLNAEQREKLTTLVVAAIDEPQFGIFGQPRINVLKLNIALDSLF